MASKNTEIAKDGADALSVFFVLFGFSEVDSPGPEDGAFHSCLPETTCNCDGGANQLDWDPGDLAMTYVPGLAQVPGTNPATGAYGYFAADHLGSTRGVYDQSKAMTAALEYAPYGEPRAWRGDAPAPTYTGHYRDAESGLYFAPYRYYLPDAGRWLTRDPLGMVDGPNVYAYVGGDPANSLDPSGQSIILICTVIIVGGIILQSCGSNNDDVMNAAQSAINACLPPGPGELASLANSKTALLVLQEKVRQALIKFNMDGHPDCKDERQCKKAIEKWRDAIVRLQRQHQ